MFKRFEGQVIHLAQLPQLCDSWSHLVIKDTLWVLRPDEPLVHVSVDISLISKHILDHDISLES